MIGRVLKPGKSVRRLLYYLYGPGKACEHVDPHLVAGWRHPSWIEPPVGRNGHRDVRRLAALLEVPLAPLGDRAPGLPVWHCTVRAAPEDPVLGDGAWMAIAGEIMHRTGLSERGREDDGVRWVAVTHGDNHIHIAAILARQDGRPVRLRNDYYRIGEAMAWAEREYGLRAVARADRTAPKRPTRAEQEKARRAGRPEPPRTVLRREVAAAAAAARSEAEFFDGLAACGVRVRLRRSTVRPDEVTGYAVCLDGDVTASGRPVWFGGGKLAADLTLPKLRRRWSPGRLSGRGMGGPAARLALRREVARCAAAARSEPEFFAGLEAAGLLVRLRADPARPGRPAGYAVSLPGLADRAGRPVWFGGGTLDERFTLPALRARWRAGRPGAGPGPELFDGADASEIYAYAAGVAGQAARELAAGRPGRADIAWAAADLLTAAAAATGNPELGRAADGFGRAARSPWGRTPVASPGGLMLRTAAYLLASCRPGGQRSRTARRALVIALAGLARAVADLRAAQQRQLQAAAAREATTRLAVPAVPGGEGMPLASVTFPSEPWTRRRPPEFAQTRRRPTGSPTASRAGPVH